MEVESNCHIYRLAVNRTNPNRVARYSLFDELYFSEDTGDSRQKAKHGILAEIRAIAWFPQFCIESIWNGDATLAN